MNRDNLEYRATDKTYDSKRYKNDKDYREKYFLWWYVLGETDPELDELRDYFSNVYSNNRLHKFALKVKNELVLKNAEALLDGRAMVLMAFRNGVFPMKD